MNYKFLSQKKTGSPQSQPIPGREAEMLQGRSGGWMFDAGSWNLLRRCLLIGTAQSTYYAGKHELTEDFVSVLREAIATNPNRVASEILYASDGHAINNSAPLLALVLLSMGETAAAKKAFGEIFPQVVRTGSHFYEWLSYTKALRGFGKVVRSAGQQWLSRQDVKGLAYQLLKYQQRHGFSHRDALRLFHVLPPTEDHNQLFRWVTSGWSELPSEIPSQALAQVWWYEWLKRNPSQTHQAIAQGHLTLEMATVGKMDKAAWQLLFNEMPIGAMLRNLGSLTELGVLRGDEPGNLERVEALLNSRTHLRKGRIHPIDILKALKTYQSGGKVGRGQKTWNPVVRIVDILEKALELSFLVVEPTGKVFMHAVDVSGSMSWGVVPSVGLSCCEIATTMALVTAKAEHNYMIRGFATDFRNLGISKKDTFSTALGKASRQNFGGTDASVAYNWMIKNKFKADVICFWTDSESWAGNSHPSQALAKYRDQVNPQIKAVYITLAPYQITLVDPKDLLSWDLAGFDPGTPRLIQMLATGTI